MSAPAAKLTVFAGPRFACIRIVGRANFVSGTELKTLINELLARGCPYFVLELSECVLMDSTFLGILAGFGLKLKGTQGPGGSSAIELLNPNTRIKELLEDLGVLHLFYLNTGAPASPPEAKQEDHVAVNPTREEITRSCLEAHQILMGINPQNVAKFKDVAAFLAEDLKKQQASEGEA
jgi:hypothetical protein